MSRPVYEEYYDGLSIMEYKDFELARPSYLILGLPDTGLVGVIAASHLARVWDMEEIGGIDGGGPVSAKVQNLLPERDPLAREVEHLSLIHI